MHACYVSFVEHLRSHGHRRIAYLGAPDRAVSYRDRERGFRQAHEALGLALEERRLLFHDPETLGAEEFDALLDGGATAIVCENHRLAIALLRLTRERGLQVPAAFSLAVLGEHHRAPDALVHATTFRIPLYEKGVRAVRMLAAALDDPAAPTERITLPCDFVPGHTVAAAPH